MHWIRHVLCLLLLGGFALAWAATPACLGAPIPGSQACGIWGAGCYYRLSQGGAGCCACTCNGAEYGAGNGDTYNDVASCWKGTNYLCPCNGIYKVILVGTNCFNPE
jgi:hypothetical protein